MTVTHFESNYTGARQQQVFIYSRPIAGIRAKMEHETIDLQTSKWHVKNIFMHLGFKYHTDQRA